MQVCVSLMFLLLKGCAFCFYLCPGRSVKVRLHKRGVCRGVSPCGGLALIALKRANGLRDPVEILFFSCYL